MDYLVHHGIKGQKWGVRRYQNEDGSYTEAGKKRIGIGKVIGAVGAGAAAVGAGIAAYVNRGKIAGANKQDLQKVRGSINQAKGSVDQVRSTARDQRNAAEKRQALEDAKNMTDEQLKERIARLNLENNYVNAISQQQVSNGSDTVDRILAVTGTVLGIAATGVGIWATVKK